MVLAPGDEVVHNERPTPESDSSAEKEIKVEGLLDDAKVRPCKVSSIGVPGVFVHVADTQYDAEEQSVEQGDEEGGHQSADSSQPAP